MYAWFFYILPGPRWLKWIITIVLLAAVVFFLMEYAFPWFDEFGFFSDATIDDGSGG